MKIEVNKRSSKEYYDEFLYIASKYRMFQQNPKTKTYRLTRFLTLYLGMALFAGVLNLLFYFKNGEILHLMVAGMLGLMLFLYVRYYVTVEKRIKAYMEDDGSKTIEMTDEYVGYKDDSKDIRISWNDLSSVLFSRYSICFIPRNQTDILISISREYEDEIRKGLEEVDKEYLITENRK